MPLTLAQHNVRIAVYQEQRAIVKSMSDAQINAVTDISSIAAVWTRDRIITQYDALIEDLIERRNTEFPRT